MEDRLFAVFDCWDFSQKIQLGFRGKAMQSLALCETKDEYLRALEAGELRHPLLVSLRVRVKQAIGDNPHGAGDVQALVVEAEPVSWGDGNEIPSDSIDALHGLLSSAGPPASERLVAAHLEDITPSPFLQHARSRRSSRESNCPHLLYPAFEWRSAWKRLPSPIRQRHECCRASGNKERGRAQVWNHSPLHSRAVPELHRSEGKLRFSPRRFSTQQTSSCNGIDFDLGICSSAMPCSLLRTRSAHEKHASYSHSYA